MDAALEGRPELCVWEFPKKSRPSKESPGLVVFAEVGAAGNLSAGFELGISAVLGRIGGAGASSPNKSMVGAACRVTGGGSC